LVLLSQKVAVDGDHAPKAHRRYCQTLAALSMLWRFSRTISAEKLVTQ
jgi:hypothetical protein